MGKDLGIVRVTVWFIVTIRVSFRFSVRFRVRVLFWARVIVRFTVTVSFFFLNLGSFLIKIEV